MHVPPYWAKAEHRFDPEGRHRVVAWRWSDRSPEEAAAAARARLEELVRAIAAGRRPGRLDYGDRPVREERLAVHPEGAAAPFAIVTRNASGAEILNAARVPFVDLDFRGARGPGLMGWLHHLLGTTTPEVAEASVVERVRRWFARYPSARGRLYRTRSGLRLLLLDRLLDPASAEAQDLLAALGSDPLYRRLCRIQGSFRARLTPKPHRVGLRRIPHEWPPADARQAEERAHWVEVYRERARGYAAARLIAELGSGDEVREARRVRELHDGAALAFGTTPLA